jgi:cyclophilin family peptidyl-prolyl cis-trans isomerase
MIFIFSIFGKTFPDEGFKNKHFKAGILSTVNFGPDTNTSQYFITSIALPYFDDKYIQ